MLMNACSAGENSQARDFQVTQRPGCSSFATSVSTLTVGSQATAILRSALAGLVGAGTLRASFAMGTRTSTEVSARLSTRSWIVRVGVAAAGILTSRSPLALRLI